VNVSFATLQRAKSHQAFDVTMIASPVDSESESDEEEEDIYEDDGEEDYAMLSLQTHVPRVGTPYSTVSIPPTPTAIHTYRSSSCCCPEARSFQERQQAKDDVKSLANDTSLTITVASQSPQTTAPPGLH
jgi:hypothetical protein